jgi:hypothetical protein
VEHDAPEHGRRGVVQVYRGARQPVEGVDRRVDDLRARLGEHGDGHVLGHEPPVGEGPAELQVRGRGRRESDLDLLDAQPDEQVEEHPLARRVHGLDEGLVAVAQVRREPSRRLVDAAVGPSAVGQTDGVDVEEVPVFRGRHPGRLLAA